MVKKYYIVIDFEANCTNEGTRDHEIIEFPAILVRTDTNTIIGEFRKFVKLIHHEKLSDFIKDLTHIDEKQMKDAVKWEYCLKEFEIWCQDYRVNSQNATIVTCGDWDFRTMFPRQNELTNTKLSGHMKKLTSEWSNVKIHFRNHTQTKKMGMPNMLDHFCLELKGHHHSGIDDSRNIQQICSSLLKEGCDITNTTSYL